MQIEACLAYRAPLLEQEIAVPLKAPTVAAWTLLLAPFCGLCGCAVPIATTPATGTTVGAQGRSSQTVFLGPDAAAAMEGVDMAGLPEYGRRDGALAVSADQPLLASVQWPERARPDLDYRRTISLPSNAGQYQYFDTGPYRGTPGGWYRWDGGGYRPVPRPWWR